MKLRAPAVCFILGLLLLSGTSESCFLVGDLNGDCRVDLNDLILMASQWLENPSCSEAGCVAHWRLDESRGSAATDSSGWGHHGTVVGGVGWNPTGGVFGGAIQFDGVSGYLWSSYQGITGSHPRTCTAWIKTGQSPGEIISWGNRDVVGGRWVVWIDETGVLRVDTGGGFVIGTTVLTDNRWHHVAVTFDGSTTDHINLYVDGQLETIGATVPQTVDTQAWATTKLGVFQAPLPSPSHYFKGLMDEVRLYDRALRLKEVWNLAATASTRYDCADLDTDQTVTLNDMTLLSQNWGDQTPLVLINEFLAGNQSRSPLGPGQILDGHLEASDWIELYNNSRIPVDLSGWYLTDDADNPTQWQFPADSGELTLEPGDYLLVFASGKTQAETPDNYPYIDPDGYLHTNFSLSKDGEYLGLFAADGITPIHVYDSIALGGGVYGYPPQKDDISYGHYYGRTRFFSPPTPGADNIAGAFTGFVHRPDVNIKGGGYVNPLEVTVTCDTPGASIRYTTDGTAPCLLVGRDYTGPITIDDSTTLIAKAFKPGLHPSDARIETYIFVEPDLAAFNSNLPIVIVDTVGQEIPYDKINRPFIDCRVIMMDTDDQSGRASMVGLDHLKEKGIGQIRYRGQSTYGQGHYALEFRDEYGRDQDVSPLGMPEESDWILSYDIIDYTLLKNEMAFQWFREMGHYAPRQRYAEVYLNTGGGKIKSRNFIGIMALREQIDRDKNRVAIARLDELHNLEPHVSGGYIIKHDKYNEGDTLLADGPGGIVDPDYLESSPYGIQVTGAGKPILQYPPAGRVTVPQIEWITGYMNQASAVLWQNTSSSYYPGPERHYTDYLDPASWIDHFIVEQAGLDSDAFWGSYRMHKDRGGKLFSGPPWDFDRGFHNNGGTYNQPYDTWRTNGGLVGRWHQKLQECPEYKMLLADRWYQHRKTTINTNQTLAHIDAQVELMSEAMARTTKPFPYGYTWQQEVDLLKTWIVNRLSWLDGEIASRFAARPPIFNPVGGEVNPRDVLYISKPFGASGTIYYTLDGTDPRLTGGGVNPGAQIYTDTNDTTSERMVEMSSSVWHYLYDGSDQGTAWRGYGFDDSSWGSGSGRLGFGQDGIVTDIGPRVAGRRSAYFRHQFNVSNVSAITALEMTVVHDDGAVVYLNGQEIGRIFLPDGEIHYDTLAAATVHSTPVTTVFSGICPEFLVEGENILAVSVHQVTDHSSDLVFDLNLEAARIAGPAQIVLDRNLNVRARIKDGDNWSAQNQARFTIPLSLLHYWHFNHLTGNTVTSVAPDHTLLNGALAAYPGTGDGYLDSTTGSDINACLGQEAGQCLRVRNPSDTRELLLTLTTTGYEAVQLSYAVRRTTNGAHNQTIQYRTDSVGDWYTLDTVTVPESYQFFRFDFSGIPAAENNPEFAVRILFSGLNAAGTSGNNRFDNITLEGLALPGTNPPSPLTEPIPFTQAIVDASISLDLSEH